MDGARIDKFYRSTKKRNSLAVEADDTSPFKKGSLAGYIVRSPTPVSQEKRPTGKVEERRLEKAATKTSLSERINKESRTQAEHPIGNNLAKDRAGTEKEQTDDISDSSSSEHLRTRVEDVQEPISDTTVQSPPPEQENHHLTSMAEEFLSICVGKGLSASEDVLRSKKRDSHALHDDLGNDSKKRHIVAKEAVNLGTPQQDGVTMKVDANCSGHLTPGVRKNSKSPGKVLAVEADDISPFKKGSLAGYIVSSRSPTPVSQEKRKVEERRLEKAATKTSLSERINKESRTQAEHPIGNNLTKDRAGTEQEQTDDISDSSSEHLRIRVEDVQEPISDTTVQSPPEQENHHLTSIAEDFLSICVGKRLSASEDVLRSKKRDSHALHDDLRNDSKKRHIVAKEAINLGTPQQDGVTMKVDASCSGHLTPGVGSQSCRPRFPKPPCTPHGCSNQKPGRLTPSGWKAQNNYSSPGEAFWEEAIQMANEILVPQLGATVPEAGVSANSPMPIRRFDFEDQRNEESSTKSGQENNEARNDEEAQKDVRKESNEDSTFSDMDLRAWLPKELCDVYSRKGLKQLYQWQVECLRIEGVLDGKSLVYCASTSAGKSLVAEILMLRKILSTERKAFLVLPYVALCSEKAEHLEAVLEPLGKRVRCFFGHQGCGSLPSDTSIAVCTIEKANSLVNKLIEEERLSELGLMVIDELHMVGDRDRGYLLELMLTKLRYAAGEGVSSTPEKLESTLQIVGMSATMPNAQEVASWLQAAVYQTEFRPVPLEEYIKVGRVVYNTNMETVRVIRDGAELAGKDQEHVVELCHEVVRDGHSVLLFCPSRAACESTARHVAKFLPKFAVPFRENESGFKDSHEAMKELEKSPAGLDPTLRETIPAGVAYHHAGLTAEEREVVESCYRQGIIRVLAATSTLAAGVNLPARRVIFRQPKVGYDYLDGTRYRQMAGRAGRAGIDVKGESILICKPEEVNRMLPILKQGCQPLRSCLSEDKNGMVRALLEVVAGGIVQTSQDVNRYVRCTLLNATQSFDDVVKSAQESLRWLCQQRLIEWDNEQQLYRTTPLGKATFGSSMTPEESLLVYQDLATARESFVLASDLHLVYEVTPIYVDLEPNWKVYYRVFMQLTPIEQAVANRVGVSEPCLMRKAHGGSLHAGFMKSSALLAKNNSVERVYRRFFVALILSKLVQEVPLADVCATFEVPRGTVQALQDSSGRFAAMVASFCERLGWHDLEGLISKFQNRVSFGVRAEIASLAEIPFVKAARARALYKAGLRTVQAVAEASIPVLTSALFEASSKALQDGSRQRWLHAAMAKRIKNGARKIVLDQAEEARKAAFSAFQALGVAVPKSLAEPLRARVDLEADLQEVLYSVKPSAELVQVNQAEPFAPLKDHAGTSRPSPSVPKPVDKGPVDVDKLEGGFEAFLKLWGSGKEFFFDFHFESQACGVCQIVGLAVCWNESPVYYVAISRSLDADARWSRLQEYFTSKELRKISWDLKAQMKELRRAGSGNGLLRPCQEEQNLFSVSIEGPCVDVRVVAWLLWPDEENNPRNTLEQVVKRRLPGEVAAVAARAGRWTNQMATSNSCCRRVAQVRGLYTVLWKLLQSEGLSDALEQLEMPLVSVLVDMEGWAIGVDMEACLAARELVGRRIKQLESTAARLTGLKFALSVPGEVADLLYKHLRLPIPAGSMGKQHPSTDKQVLESLRNKHPVVAIIKEHRSLSKLLQTTIGGVTACAKVRTGKGSSHFISGQWLHTSTGTGRLSMEEPNLQCIEHPISFLLDDAEQQIEVNARDFFVPSQENWLLLSADYSQIEFRLMAHFSGDPALIALLNKPGDAFRMIASQWMNRTCDAEVSETQREQTKRLVYGILYGMGINTLAEKMECSVGEARSNYERFKAEFPGLSAWLQEAVHSCRQNGHVKTLAGRKRYLEKINNSKRGDQAKAERQAVNSICQGSAADLIKMAMIDLHSALVGRSSKTAVYTDANGARKELDHNLLQGRCRLLLQIHDELLLEVDRSIVNEAAVVTRACMQGAASLKVPLKVKVQVGSSWGQLRPLPSIQPSFS